MTPRSQNKAIKHNPKKKKKAIYAREISRKTNSGYLAALYKIYEALILLLLMLKVEMTNG